MKQKRLHIDIETYSSADLPKYGVYKYAAAPDFQILMAAWSLDGSPVRVAVGEKEIDAIPGLRDPNVMKVAHNAQFERVCFSRYFGVDGYLPPEEWHDTQAVAAEKGYPKSLGKCAIALGVSEKDTAGTRLISLFCKPNRSGERTLPEQRPDDWIDFIAYCHQDVVTLMEIDEKLGDFPTKRERQVYIADQRINDRGIAIDVPLAREAVRAAQGNERHYKKQVTELTGGLVENANSIQQMGKWFKSEGLKVPNLRAETVTGLLAGDLTPTQRKVLECRQELALAASKKFATALNMQVDGRLRGTLQFFGAHTGRWAGRGTQIQNLPRLAFENEQDQDIAILELMLGGSVSQEDLKKLVRPMFIGPFTVVDYSAIEARVLAWLAGEQWTLDAFEEGRDIYVETAERMGGGMGRYEGKIAVLALGYNGAVGSLRAMGYGGKPLASDTPASRQPSGEDWGGGTVAAARKEAPEGYKSDAELVKIVRAWREANKNIVSFWYDLEHRFIKGGPVGKYLRVEKEGKSRFIRLPSGRRICYHGCSIRVDDTGRDRITFISPNGYRTDTYGGRLAENVTQAVARDLLADALVRLDRKGYRVVGHVHDEILVEGEHSVDEISRIMCWNPKWAPDLPLDGAGFQTYRYKKD